MQMHSMVMFSILVGGSFVAAGQGANAQEPKLTPEPIITDHQELLREIKVCEDALHNAEAVHAAPETLARIDLTIGGFYEDMGSFPQSEAWFQHAVEVVRKSRAEDQAIALDSLAGLHVMMGEIGKAEKESRQVIALWQKAGNARGVAFAQIDLANAEIRQQKFAKATDDAQKSLAVIGNDPAVLASDRIAVRQTLGYALSGDHRCPEAMAVLNDALQLDKSSFGSDSLAAAIGYYMLGHAAWKCGNMADAAAWMQRGTDQMRAKFGWGHPIYVTAMTEYARFLRERGQVDEAASAEREVRMSNSVVDARTLGSVPANGLR